MSEKLTRERLDALRAQLTAALKQYQQRGNAE